MHPSSRPTGIYSAQWIPTDLNGDLDRGSLARHIEFERAHGIRGILALGSTGEFPHFDLGERKEALTIIAEIATGLTTYANITDIRPKAAIELGRFAKILGYSAVALMPPVFYPMSQADILAYFLHVAEAVELPVMLYNFPELTGKRIELSTIAEFADRAPMVAIKQSGRDFAYHSDLIALGRIKGFNVMSGSDTRIPETVALGATGCIGGLVNIVPDLMVQIERACQRGDPASVLTQFEQVATVGRIIDQLTFPLNVAAGLEARGMTPGFPKAIVSVESRALYMKIVQELSAAFLEWGLSAGACSPQNA